MLNYNRLPEHTRHGAQMWIEHGVLPGDFLRAVISNKLKESFMFADHKNLTRMFDIVSFFYNEAPASCWGSEEKVAKWFSHSGLAGLNLKATNEKDSFGVRRTLTLIKDKTP